MPKLTLGRQKRSLDVKHQSGRRAGGGRDTIRHLLEAEIGTVRKPFGAQLPVALVYPNTYYVGMSSLGFQTLTGRINRRPDAACERVFWSLGEGDTGEPLSIENQRPLGEFPLIAFSISYEMDYPNVLDTLKRAGIPLRATARREGDPVIVCGGKAVTMNRMPLWDFIDVFVHGDGEEAIDHLIDAVLARDVPRGGGGGRRGVLERLAALPGFEVPPLAPDPGDEVAPPKPAQISLATRLSEFAVHSNILTPHTEFAMRGLIEISRGCPYKCTFCIMGYQPYRYNWRSVDDVIEMAQMFRRHTDKVGLVASAVGIHREIETICERLDSLDMNVSFSSLRVEDVKPRMVDSLLRSGQRTLTIAPEAGNTALRKRMRKNLSDEQLLEFAASTIERGMSNLKLYYMIGIPGETDEDVLDIARFSRRMHDVQVRAARAHGEIGKLVLNAGVFVPKPGTPLGEGGIEGGFCGVEEARRKYRLLERALADIPNLEFHRESPRVAAAQAFLANGGRAAGRTLEHNVLSGEPLPRLAIEAHG